MAQTGFALDANTGELFMDPTTKSLAMNRDTVDTIRQRVETELTTFLGEYMLNEKKGLPYFSEMMKKNPNIPLIRSLIASKISTIEGVRRIVELTVAFSASLRKVSVSFRLLADTGEQFEGEI